MNDKKRVPARPRKETRVEPKASNLRKVPTERPVPRPAQYRTLPSPTKR